MAAVGTFGEALKRLRGDTTQEELARRVGMSRATIAGLESNKAKEPRWETAVTIARALGVSLDAFAQATDDALEATKPAALDRLAALEADMADLRNLPTEVRLLNARLIALADGLRSAGVALPPQAQSI